MRAMAAASNGGTAFPICWNCADRDPSNTNWSGKLWRRAASRTEIVRHCVGCMNMYPSLDKWDVTVHDGLSIGRRLHLSLKDLSLYPIFRLSATGRSDHLSPLSILLNTSRSFLRCQRVILFSTCVRLPRILRWKLHDGSVLYFRLEFFDLSPFLGRDMRGRSLIASHTVT